ncbi:hypothetical protein FH589_06440 [Leptospira interrogans]|uniref:hypothetical protein n=1 Tax=Leptospira interrogans TaxID=173 RepID=UPI0010C10CAE|nr:hypothetical protein [Leptospira interrogans]KAA1267905.1 hypothetical protein C5473_07650 [Leptospira interrogans serovar Weerasinghe]QCO40276.1 hypothetical protein E4413_04535 [Leptospira interrogans]ULG79053.1 hypothetical protein FH595_09525 [Leptospira interrogans]ULG92597.1 hypothetical protein FH584_01265 [Leptospira interrogans]UML69777.1 hypothetical protein FH589_06440 [Leptospira interrogans]
MSSIIDSLSALSVSIRDLIALIVSPKGLITLVSLLILIVASLIVYEYTTDQFYLSRYQKKLILFERIASFDPKKIQAEEELLLLRRNLITELNEYQPKKKFSLNQSLEIPVHGWEGVLKFISGAFFGILMLFYGVFSTEEDRKDTIIGSILYSVVVGGIFYFIPIIFFPWVNYFILPIVPFILLLGYSKISGN